MSDPIYQHGPTGQAAAWKHRVEQARQAACLFEELIAWRTPGWQRNPVNAAVEIHRRGYAVYDGLHAQPSHQRGTTTDRRGASDDTHSQP